MDCFERPMTRFDEALPLEARQDPLGPPDENVEVWCLHCRDVFFSDEMVWYLGLWCCPKIVCGGVGFGCDIFSTAPGSPASER